MPIILEELITECLILPSWKVSKIRYDLMKGIRTNEINVLISVMKH